MACAKPPPMGLCDYPSSRAIYAIDLMLKWDSHPDGKGTLHTRTFHPGLETSSTWDSPGCSRVFDMAWFALVVLCI